MKVPADGIRRSTVAKLAMAKEREAINAAIVRRFGALASTSHFSIRFPSAD
jgi:hypothetical protein